MTAANPTVKIAPSILSADFSRLGEQVKEAADGGADYIHVDIMDGRFVPNLTIGPEVVRAIRPWTDIPLDVHMMVSEPERFAARFAEAGADIVTVHVEACTHLHRTVQQIAEAGARPGVAINPATPVHAVEEVLGDVAQVLVMSVNPGFGGQAFIESSVDKIARTRSLLERCGADVDLEVDGGINVETAGRAAAAGANVLVAGSAVFNDKTTIADAIAQIRAAAVPIPSPSPDGCIDRGHRLHMFGDMGYTIRHGNSVQEDAHAMEGGNCHVSTQRVRRSGAVRGSDHERTVFAQWDQPQDWLQVAETIP